MSFMNERPNARINEYGMRKNLVICRAAGRATPISVRFLVQGQVESSRLHVRFPRKNLSTYCPLTGAPIDDAYDKLMTQIQLIFNEILV